MTDQGRYGIRGEFDNSAILRGFNQVNSAAAKTTQQVNQLNQQTRGLGTVMGNVFNRPAQSLIFLGLDLQQLGRSMAVVGGAVVGAGAAAGKFAVDFGDALARVNALAQLSDEGILRVGNRIRDLATDPQVLQGPIELANSLQFLISSGFTVGESLGVLRTASIGATAGVAELETVTRALASTMNALPAGTITSQEALDIMFETVDKGIITFDELTSTMGEVLGAVGATGIEFEEFGAAVSVLTRAGIPASEAMTSLNRVLTEFISPGTEAKKLAAELGVELNVDALRGKGLVESLDEIKRAVGDDAEAMRTLFNEQRAFRGVLALTEDLDEFRHLLDEQRLATEGLGAANEALEKQLQAPGAALQLLKRDIESAGIAIGEDFLPAMITISRALRDVVQGFAGLDDSVKNSVFIFGAALAAAGGVAFTFGTVATAAGAIRNAMQFIASVTKGATTGLLSTNQAMQQQAIAANAAAAANTNLARSLTAVSTTGAVAGAAGLSRVRPGSPLANAAGIQAAGAAAQGVQQLNTASTAAAFSFGRLLSLAGNVAVLGTVAFIAKEAGDALLDFAINAQTAGRSTQELGRRLDDLSKPRDFDWIRALSGPGGLGQAIADQIVRAKELQATLKELSQPQTRPEFIQRIATQRGVPTAEAEEIAKRQADIANAAIRQATSAQEDAFLEAQEKLEQLKANFREAIAGAGDDPALQQRLEASYQRLLVEGPRAATESGFSQLSTAQKAAFRQMIDGLEAQAQQLEKAGNKAGADFSRGLAEQLQRDVGFDLEAPVNIEFDFAPAIAEAKKKVTDLKNEMDRQLAEASFTISTGETFNTKTLEKAQAATRLQQLRLGLEMADALRPFDAQLRSLELAQRAVRAEQTQLNLVMEDAQRAFKAAQNAVDDIEKQISALQDTIQDLESQFQAAAARLGNLGQPVEIGVKVVLQGLPQLEDQIFGIGQEIAALQLQLLNVNATFIPGMFDAEEAVLRAKLALLEMGDEAEALGKKASFGIDDLISAQQRELREGVPVLRTIFDKIRAAAEGKEGADAKSPEEEALAAAEKSLEILRIRQQLETLELRRKIEIAGVEQQRLNLTKQLTFDPQIRELEKLATILKEVTFEEAKAGILAARDDMASLRSRIEEATAQQNALNEQLAGANAILADRQRIIDDLARQQEELQRRASELAAAEQALADQRDQIAQGFEDRQEALQRRMTEFQIAEAEILIKQGAIQETFLKQIGDAQAVVDSLDAASKRNVNIPTPESMWSSDVGDSYPIPFSTEQQQASNQMVNSARAALQAADEDAGLIAALFRQLREALGGSSSSLAAEASQPVFGYHTGGPVHGLVGSDVPAVLQAGEHVLNRGQVQVIRAAGIDPSHIHQLIGAMHRYHEGGPVGSVPMVAAPSVGAPAALGAPSSNWNWNVVINNQRGTDPYAKIYRAAYARHLGGRWR